MCGNLASDGSMVVERTTAFRAAEAAGRRLLDEAAMRAEIRTRDVPVVTHTAPPPPEFELVDPDAPSDDSRWPLTQNEALGIALQDPWRASEDGQLMGCQFHGAPRQATVTYGFDFDGTLL